MAVKTKKGQNLSKEIKEIKKNTFIASNDHQHCHGICVLNTVCTYSYYEFVLCCRAHVSAQLPGLPRAPRAPLFVDRAVEVGLTELWAAAAAAANVARFCSWRGFTPRERRQTHQRLLSESGIPNSC